MRVTTTPAPHGYRDVIISGPPHEIDPILDQLELTDGVVGFSRRLLLTGGNVAVKVRMRDNTPLVLLPAGDRLPATRTRAPVAGREAEPPPLRAQAVTERPAPAPASYRPGNLPWWHDRRTAATAGLAATVAAAVVIVVALLIQVGRAGAQAATEHWAVIIGALTAAGGLLLVFATVRRRRRRGGGCSGLHCNGCGHHKGGAR